MNPLERVHSGYVHNRRVRVLSAHLAKLIPHGARVLDVGAGDGLLAAVIMQHRPDVDINGIDTCVRGRTHIPVARFDGRGIPHGDASFDVVMFVDVLHHTEEPLMLLREAARVARKAVVIKDHTRNGLFANLTLRFMDWVGNARHGVVLPYTYWPQRRWLEAFAACNLTIREWEQDLRLYPRPASWMFDRSLHFITRLTLNGVENKDSSSGQQPE
jgi:SAM-dependent methyltransferase